MNKPICLNFPADLVARLDAAAAEADRTRSSMVRKIVEHHLRQHAAMSGQAPILEPTRGQPAADVSASVDGHLARHGRLSRQIVNGGFLMGEPE